MIDTASLPTPLALVVRRLNVCGPENSADTFLHASYVTEAALKLLAISLVAGLERRAPDHAYRLAYGLVRADGLGLWDAAIRQVTTPPLAGFLVPPLHDIASWAGRKRTGSDSEWYEDAARDLGKVFALLDLESGIPDRKPTVQHLLAALVQLRNKTRAHGAAGEDFFAEANPPFVAAVARFLTNCPLFGWQWVHLTHRPDGRIRGIRLRGTDPQHMQEEGLSELPEVAPGVYLWPAGLLHPIGLGSLIRANRECTQFSVPNGGYTDSANASFIDYGNGREGKVDVQEYSRPPVALPPSETEGLSTLVVQSNTLGNLPDQTSTYVPRPVLERDLKKRLTDQNHPIVTLHGRGGIGKTSLALRVAHELSELQPALYDEVVWFSARDVDLLIHGPRPVRPRVVSLEAVATTFGKLTEREQSIEALADALQNPDPITGRGRLLIFDNFETMSDIKGMHEFLDTHTHLPNKVLITSRERAFKADYPIELQGMEWNEASQLMSQVAASLNAEALLTGTVAERIFEFAEGHPYVMRILVGELAKEGRYVPPKSLMPRRSDILDAVFQRSFVKLSDSGRWVFLLTANWNSAIAETGLLVVLGGRDLDAEVGVEECTRLSLIVRVEFSDGRSAFVAPQVARLFGKKKLTGDPDRLLIQADLELVRQFGVLPTGEPIRIPEEDALRKFTHWALEEAYDVDRERLERTVELLAELWPPGWTVLAELRSRRRARNEDVEYALRRAVEDAPTDPEAWRARADFALRVKDDSTFIAARIRSAELEPDSVPLLRDVAHDVCGYVTKHKEIPVARRSVYLASVRSLMLGVSGKLDATGLSRLAWLFLLEENKPEAWRWAAEGLAQEAHNEHCYKIVERLKRAGYYGPSGN